jgi:hypothetical protein
VVKIEFFRKGEKTMFFKSEKAADVENNSLQELTAEQLTQVAGGVKKTSDDDDKKMHKNKDNDDKKMHNKHHHHQQWHHMQGNKW